MQVLFSCPLFLGSISMLFSFTLMPYLPSVHLNVISFLVLEVEVFQEIFPTKVLYAFLGGKSFEAHESVHRLYLWILVPERILKRNHICVGRITSQSVPERWLGSGCSYFRRLATDYTISILCRKYMYV